MDLQVDAVRMGWLPFYPQFNRNPIQLVRDAEEAGAHTAPEIADWMVNQLRTGKVRFSVEEPDLPENWPRVWLIWRANALHSSAKGHEYFLRHYLGTHSNAIADEVAQESVQEVDWRESAPQGKMDLVVDLNFRMDTSALYSDVILPSASWYEKNDLNTTDLHSYYSSAGRGGSAVLGIAERLGHFPCSRGKDQRTGAHPLSRAVSGPGRDSTAARHPG